MPIQALLKVRPAGDESILGFEQQGKKFLMCEILGADRSYHALKDLERSGLFKKIGEYLLAQGRQPALINYAQEYADRQNQPLDLIKLKRKKTTIKPETPKRISIGITVDANATIQQIQDLFKNNFDCKITIVNDYSVSTTPNMTFKEYAQKIDDGWFEKVDKESEKLHSIRSGEKIPNIDEYNKLSSEPEKAKNEDGKNERRKIVKTGTEQDDLNWKTPFTKEDAVKEAIREAIHRIEEFDEEGNLPTCPITMERFEGHNKVILILSKNPEDGLLHASFVHAGVVRDNNNEKHLRETKKSPLTNNPIVAMEIDTLDNIKNKYILDSSRRPFI